MRPRNVMDLSSERIQESFRGSKETECEKIDQIVDSMIAIEEIWRDACDHKNEEARYAMICLALATIAQIFSLML